MVNNYLEKVYISREGGLVEANLEKVFFIWLSLGDGEKRQGNLMKNKHFFGDYHFFRYLPEFLDPKCYTWLESFGSEDSHGKKLKIFGLQNFVNTLDSKSSHQLTPCRKCIFYFA